MNYKALIFIAFLFVISSCKYNYSYNQNKIFSSNGFVLIYNDKDLQEKIISKKLINDKIEVAHNSLPYGTLLNLRNPQKDTSLDVKVLKKSKYPDFYELVITKATADNLMIDEKFPYVEITEIKKNDKFIAKKTLTHIEERKISKKAPVEKILVNDLSKNKERKIIDITKKNYYITIASFYSKEIAIFLQKRLKIDLPQLKSGKILVKSINKTTYEVKSGPYSSVDEIKLDYMLLKDYGFEDLNIKFNE